MIIDCVGFCVDELLWMLSWGWYQLFFGICFFWSFCTFVMRMKMGPALVLTLGSYAFAMFVYFACVAGLFITYFQWQFIAGNVPNVYTPLSAALFLGVIYSTLQLLFFWLITHWCQRSVMQLFIYSVVSNGLGALLASYFIK